jgi:iron complex transport system ATP-binding protein
VSLLIARALHVAYGTRAVLHGVELALDAGEVLAIVGPNGAGKTSLFRALSGVLAPSSGEILLRGRALSSLGRAGIARALAVVPQHVPSAPGFTVREVVAMGRAPHQDAWLRERPQDVEAVERALARCDLGAFAAREFDLLSGGERKRVMVAQALAQSADVLLLDEPSAFLDLRHAVALFGLAREEAARGAGVVAIVHDLSLAARFCHRVALLVDGRLVALGTPDDVLTEARLEAAFGVPIVRLSDAAAHTIAFAPGGRSR